MYCFYIIFIVLSSSLLSTATSSSKSTKNNEDDKLTIDSLKDIEVLTYFLLWKYHYFEESILRDSFFETKHFKKKAQLRNFLENLKQEKFDEQYANLSLSFSSSFSSSKSLINCYNIDGNLADFQEIGVSRERIRKLCELANNCRSPAQLTELVSNLATESGPQTISQAVVRLCPLMLFQLHDEQCLKEQRENIRSRPSIGSTWGFGVLFVTIVSFCSLIGVAIMPFLTKSSYYNILTLFEGLAVGSLVGSAVFHLIPQAFDLVGKDSDHGYLWKALILFGGIYLFFCSERIMKIVVEVRRKNKMKDIAQPSCTSDQDDQDKPKLINYKERKVCFSDGDAPNGFDKSNCQFVAKSDELTSLSNSLSEKDHKSHFTLSSGTNSRDSISLQSLNRDRSRSNSFTLRHGHSHGDVGKNGEIATVAWMIIFGDGLHNFIDGLSIGAAFSESILSGISISVACICEEFPHELGDFAVLIASGMTLRQAVGYNFLSACTCYLGMAVGILLGDLKESSSYIFALAAGMFLYIALVDMMGELSSTLDEASKKSMTETFKVLLLQHIGILVGVSALLFLAKYGEKINFEGLAPPPQSDMPFTANIS